MISDKFNFYLLFSIISPLLCGKGAYNSLSRLCSIGSLFNIVSPMGKRAEHTVRDEYRISGELLSTNPAA